MGKMITASIDVTKLDKSLFVKGKAREGGDPPIYANIIIFENDEADRFGNTHAIKQSAPKDDRQRKMPYLGNGRELSRDAGRSYEGGSGKTDSGDGDDDDIPF